ncbi:MAG: diacylglycerol/lipid kinase family protein, partial [Planctomycetota bacterium]
MASATVLILYNPVAGGGRAERAATRLDVLLRGAGYETDLATTRPETGDDRVDHAPAARALVVVGGDGAVRAAAVTAIRGRTPLYHVPCGTANLFAREFAMTRHPDRLLEALKQNS